MLRFGIESRAELSREGLLCNLTLACVNLKNFQEFVRLVDF